MEAPATRHTDKISVKRQSKGPQRYAYDEDQVLGVRFRLTGAPFHTRLGDIGPILLRSSQ